MSHCAMRLVIEGRVQGVGYRWWAVRTARELGLAGWVRNRRDGSVEALAIGPEPAVARFVEACRQGPAAADVRSVGASPAADDGAAGFTERETA